MPIAAKVALKVLQLDEVQEASTYYARVCDWFVLFQDELSTRDLPESLKEAIVLEYARATFMPKPAQLPQSLIAAIEKQASALNRSIPTEEDE